MNLADLWMRANWHATHSFRKRLPFLPRLWVRVIVIFPGARNSLYSNALM